jgi:integrase
MSRPTNDPRLEQIGRVHYIVYNDPDKWNPKTGKNGAPERKSTGTSDKGEALEALGHFLIDYGRRLQNGSAGTTTAKPKEAQLTVADALDRYEREVIPTMGKHGRNGGLSRLRYLRAEFDVSMPATAVTKDVMNRYKAKRLTVVGTGSVLNEFILLHAALNRLIKSGDLVVNIANWEYPEKPPRREHYLATDELDQLILTDAKTRRIDERMCEVEIFCHVAMRTAARADAVRELTWDRVDFLMNTVDFRSPQWLALPKKRRNVKKRTVVPMSDELRRVLTLAKEERSDEFVVPQNRGRKSDTYTFRKWTTIPKASAHVLRHSWATHKSAAGVGYERIADMMGIDPTMAREVYIKFNPNNFGTIATEDLYGKAK